MKDIIQGQIVFSKSGRDKGSFFVVTDYIQPFAYLCDGRLRRLENPKKKKDKHIQTTNYVDKDLQEIFSAKSRLNNADIRKSLSHYLEEVKPQQ